MSKTMVRCEFIGYLGADPEMRYTGGGSPVVNFRVAVSKEWKDKQTGEPKKMTEWFGFEAWGNMAEAIAKYLSKGSKVFVEAKWVKQSAYLGKQDGLPHPSNSFVVSEIIFLDGAKAGETLTHAPAATAGGNSVGYSGSGFDFAPDGEDEIPF